MLRGAVDTDGVRSAEAEDVVMPEKNGVVDLRLLFVACLLA